MAPGCRRRASPRSASRPRSARSWRRASSASAPDERAVAERASVVGRVFEQAAVTELATDDLAPEVGRSAARARAQGADPPRALRAVGRRRLQVPPHPHPRRRLRGPPEGRAGESSTSASPTGSSAARPSDPGETKRSSATTSSRRIATGSNSAMRRAASRALAARALRLVAPAGRTALKRGDPHAAVALLRRAVGLSAPGPEQIELLIDLRSALRTAGDCSGIGRRRSSTSLRGLPGTPTTDWSIAAGWPSRCSTLTAHSRTSNVPTATSSRRAIRWE